MPAVTTAVGSYVQLPCSVCKHCLVVAVASGSYGLSAPSSMTIPEPWGAGAIEAAFRIGHAIVSSSLYLDQLWVSDEGLEMPSSMGAEINHPMSFYYYVHLTEW